jgi:polyhydroxyalkanoate synthase
VKRAFQLSSFDKLVTKPIAIAAKLDDADFLAQIEAVDRFTANMIAYPGRTFGQLYHRMVRGNQLARGSLTLDDREVRLADITVPLLAFGGAADGIAPVQSVRPIVDLATGVDELRFEIVPGGHLGMLTGRAARRTTWRILDDWLTAHATEPAVAEKPSRRAAKKTAAKGAAKKSTKKSAKKAAAKKAARKSTAQKSPAKKSPAKKSPARKPRADAAAIGANPARRYSSASSRTLAATLPAAKQLAAGQ